MSVKTSMENGSHGKILKSEGMGQSFPLRMMDLGSDGYVHYLNYGEAFMSVYICQN